MRVVWVSGEDNVGFESMEPQGSVSSSNGGDVQSYQAINALSIGHTILDFGCNIKAEPYSIHCTLLIWSALKGT